MSMNEIARPLLPSQETQLRNWLTENWKQDPISAAILLLAWDAGLSSGEISTLRWESVDLSGGLLEIGERRIPLESMLEDLLNELIGDSIYIIPNGRNNYTPMNRVSVSRRARQALNRARVKGVTLADLRDDFMLRIIARQPLESVVEISGYEVRSVQEFARRYGVRPPCLSHGKSAGSGLTTGALLNALEQEGDTLDSRIVVLSWLGGLTLEQMARLSWEDISLPTLVWIIAGNESPIPKDLLPYLKRWWYRGNDTFRLLHGPRSERPLSIHELSRRGREFFIRYHLHGYSLALLRGKAEPALLRYRVMELARSEKRLSTGKVASAMEISPGKSRNLLQKLAEEGMLVPSSPGVYMMPGEKKSYQRLLDYLQERKGQTVSRKDISRLLDAGSGSVTYYIEKARKDGLLKRSGRGQYHIL